MIHCLGKKKPTDCFNTVLAVPVVVSICSVLLYECCLCRALPLLSPSSISKVRIQSSPSPHVISQSYGQSKHNVHYIFQVVSGHDTKRFLNPFNNNQYHGRKCALYATPEKGDVELTTENNNCNESFVKSIQSFNIGGIKDYDNDKKEVSFDLGDVPQLVAVTGETGSGKSLLLAHVANLVAKGITAKSSIVSPKISFNTDEDTNQETSSNQMKEQQVLASCQIDIQLGEPHKTFVLRKLDQLGLHASFNEIKKDNVLVLKRAFVCRQGKQKNRMMSKYFINNQVVSSKVMKTIATPLITTVDATTAAGLLAKPQSRLNIIDCGVDSQLLHKVQSSQREYRKAKRKRQELAQKNQEYHDLLPSSYLPVTTIDEGNQKNKKQMELLQHWIEELDKYESRIHRFQQQLQLMTSKTSPNDFNKETFHDITQKVLSNSWTVQHNINDEDQTKNSELYYGLIDLREIIKTLEVQLQSAYSAVDILSSRSSSVSVQTLLDQTRDLLFDASGHHGENGENRIQKAAEKAHELLNQLEDTLSICVKSIEDDSNGMIPELQKIRDNIHGVIKLEEMDLLIGDWGALARKHGVAPDMLPSCHQSLRQELDGNEDIMMQLLDAKAKEKFTLQKYKNDCELLTSARNKVAEALTKSVSERLPYLGMEGTFFQAQISTIDIDDAESSSVEHFSQNRLGVDTVEFLLLHQQSSTENTNPKTTKKKESYALMDDFDSSKTTTQSLNHLIESGGGKLEVVGSSGEKARILLAIETDLPGSMGVICNYNNIVDSSRDFVLTNSSTSDDNNLRPIAMIYDEIDAHVGGQAAVSVAKLLSDQTRGKKSVHFGKEKKEEKEEAPKRSQIICITHSPSIAAIADHHLVVRKSKINLQVHPDNNELSMLTQVKIQNVHSVARTKEIARMASGDLAIEEAELFAKALLRDGVLHVTKRNLDDVSA